MSEILLNLLRLLVLVTTIASFAPQILRITQRKSCDGIALWYLFLNFVCAVEPVGKYAGDFAIRELLPSGLVHNPPSVGDWLNLAQVASVAGLTLMCLAMGIYYPPGRPVTKSVITALTVITITTVMAPAAIMSTAYFRNTNRDSREMFWIVMLYAHFVYLVWILLAAQIWSGVVQACAMLYPPSGATGDLGSLSLVGLVVQAVAFLAAGATWPFRLVPQAPPSGPHDFWSRALQWYGGLGYLVVGNGLFGVVQAVIFVVGVRKVRASAPLVGENRPLLGEH